MPWAHEEPSPVEAVAERLRGFRGRFDLDEEYVYGLFSADGREVVGGSGFHRRVGPEALEIGYWIRAERVRRGLATEATAALTQVAFRTCGAARVDIHVDPANAPSLAIPARLGFRREATLRRRLPAVPPSTEARDQVVFSLLEHEYPDSPSAVIALEAFDAAGTRVI
jgi:RimJ/RimL family protein N-acetyltransferase